MKISSLAKIVSNVTCLFAISGGAFAATDPVTMLYNFQANGQFTNYDQATGKSTYTINALGRAPKVGENGTVTPPRTIDDDGYTVVLTNAAITFDAFNPVSPDPIVKFSCHGCKLKFPDGSTLESDPSVPLEGRALFVYGPVAPNPATPNIMTIRMAGCSGLSETANKG